MAIANANRDLNLVPGRRDNPIDVVGIKCGDDQIFFSSDHKTILSRINTHHIVGFGGRAVDPPASAYGE